jgi:hypothetical protein
MNAKEKYKAAKAKAGSNFHQIRPSVQRTDKDKAETRQALKIDTQREVERYEV